MTMLKKLVASIVAGGAIAASVALGAPAQASGCPWGATGIDMPVCGWGKGEKALLWLNDQNRAPGDDKYQLKMGHQVCDLLDEGYSYGSIMMQAYDANPGNSYIVTNAMTAMCPEYIS